MTLLLLVGGAVLGAIASVIAAVFFTEAVENAAVRFLGAFAPSRQGRRLQGSWNSYYEVCRHEEPPPAVGAPLVDDNKGRIAFHRLGSTIVGRNESGTRHYSLRLKLRDNTILTGTWSDISEGRYHFGAVQLAWSYDGKYVAGRFVGRDRNNRVNHGYWILALDEKDIPGIVDQYRVQYRANSIPQ